MYYIISRDQHDLNVICFGGGETNSVFPYVFVCVCVGGGGGGEWACARFWLTLYHELGLENDTHQK